MKIQMIQLADFNNFSKTKQEFLLRSKTNLKVRFKNPSFPTIQINENGDWVDLKVCEDYVLKQGDFAMLDLGVAMKIPARFEAWLVPRSSTFKHFGVLQVNGVGIIDNSYSGNNDIWKMPVYATRDTIINKGDRLCQFRLVERMDSIFNRMHVMRATKREKNFIILEVDQLDSLDRGGFGTSGR